MYGVRKCSSFSLLQVVDQISQYHLFKEIVFNPLYILASFVKDKVSICTWIYLWAFYFVPLIYISVFVPVPYCLDNCGFVVECRQILYQLSYPGSPGHLEPLANNEEKPAHGHLGEGPSLQKKQPEKVLLEERR